MGKIAILPDTLCNQIAAGEVVERPAAVIKELMENSIDAGSRRIVLSLLQGGRKEIRLVDNGSGMSSDDALLAIERHATSKIKTFEDLESIQSLGFRGEALPSIAAVSRFELATREASAISGTLIHMDGGVLRDVRETGCPVGTMITVRDLFHNVPARRKFLRSIDTEMAHVSDQFLRLALAHPDIHFQLIHQDRSQYDFPRAKSLMARAGQVLGTGLMSKLQPFSNEGSDIKLHGLASSPDIQRPSAQSLFACVNGRPVWDRTINRAILSAYDSLLPRGKFPVVVLFMGMSPTAVDVNVHPTKREVRFRNPGEIIELVRDTIRKALETVRPSSCGSEPWGHALPKDGFFPPKGHGARESQFGMDVPFQGTPQERLMPPPAQVSAFQRIASSQTAPAVGGDHERGPGSMPIPGDEPFFSRLSVLGQFANAYILLEAPDGLILIDQHAAHERILFNGLSSKLPIEAGQRLMQSVVVELMPREAAMLRRWVAQLAQIGFEIESFGGDSFVVHAVPAILQGHSPEVLIRELVEAAQEEENSPRWDLLGSLTKTAACHGAIRAGQRLQQEEIRRLLQALDRTRISATCPHGRPVWFKLTHAEIARLFHRT